MLNANLCVLNEQNSLVCADLNPLTPLPPRHGSRGPARRGGPGGHLTLLTTPAPSSGSPSHASCSYWLNTHEGTTKNTVKYRVESGEYRVEYGLESSVPVPLSPLSRYPP